MQEPGQGGREEAGLVIAALLPAAGVKRHRQDRRVARRKLRGLELPGHQRRHGIGEPALAGELEGAHDLACRRAVGRDRRGAGEAEVVAAAAFAGLAELRMLARQGAAEMAGPWAEETDPGMAGPADVPPSASSVPL